MELENERKFVNNLVSDYITSGDSKQACIMRDLTIKTFKPFIKKGFALELGCEIGYMTEQISKLVEYIDIVDASEEFLKKTKEREIPNSRFFNLLFEEFYPDENTYDCVFANHILEHLIDVNVVLKMIKKSLKEDGLLFVVVPNARALSRQLARHMELIENLFDLTENDLRGGHRRVYDRTSLNRDLVENGFDIISQGGIFLKPFADFQLDKMLELNILGTEQIEGLYKLGLEYPDLCGSLFSICRVK